MLTDDTNKTKIIVTIYGRGGCSYCKKALRLVDDLSEKDLKETSVEHIYLNITDFPNPKEKLQEIVGKPVTTVPQIFIQIGDKPQEHIGGFNEFNRLVLANKTFV